jgi:hypothetical protein
MRTLKDYPATEFPNSPFIRAATAIMRERRPISSTPHTGNQNLLKDQNLRQASVYQPPLYLVKGVDNNQYKLTEGKINGLVPAPLTFTVSTGTLYVWAKVIAVFGTPTDNYTVSIVTTTTDTTPTNEITTAGFTSHRLLGKVVSSTQEITNNHAGGNLNAEAFGSAVFWWIG